MFRRVQKEVDMYTRHLEILEVIIVQGPIDIAHLSEQTGYPDHKVRYSLRFLEVEGLIKSSESEITPTDQTKPFLESSNDRIAKTIQKLEALRSQLRATSSRLDDHK